MSRIRIRTLRDLTREDVRRLVPGYVSNEVLVLHPDPAPSRLGFHLERTSRTRPFRKRYPLSPREWELYRGYLQQGVSLGAYDDARLVGIALVEARDNLLWVWELGVLEPWRRRGIGSALLRELERRGHAAGFRAIALETQTTNVPALDFYRRSGFALRKIDPEFYPKRLRNRGEVAVFLRKTVRGARPHKRSTRRNHDRSRG